MRVSGTVGENSHLATVAMLHSVSVARSWIYSYSTNSFFCCITVVSCPTLSTNVSNANVSGVLYTYNSQVTFTCQRGFHIFDHSHSINTRVLQCQNNGQWNDTEPACTGEKGYETDDFVHDRGCQSSFLPQHTRH